eukprot:gene940-2585_t
MEFEGKVAIVTGSSSGIGKSVAERLIVVNSSTSVEAGEAVAAGLGGEAMYFRADISKQQHLHQHTTNTMTPHLTREKEEGHALIEATLKRFGQIDILVNNAGWTKSTPHDDLEALTDEVFDKTFKVNVYGTWWLTKAAIPHLKKSSDPAVVTVTSLAGVRAMGSSIAYCMAKAALNHMTQLLAKAHPPVRVNAVAPGLVATPWTENWTAMHEAVAEAAPMHRSATADDCAEAVLAMLRCKYATGQVFVVDGGLGVVK